MVEQYLKLFRQKEYAKVLEELSPSKSRLDNWRLKHLYLLCLAEVYPREFNTRAKGLDLRSHPNWPGLYFDIGNIFLKHGLHTQAIDAFRKCLDINGSYLDAKIGLAKALLSQKKYKESEAIASKLEVELSSRRFEVFQVSSKLRYFQDDFVGALRYSVDSVGLQRDTPTAALNHAVILSDLRRYDEAKGYYERSLQLRPDYEKAHQYLGQVLLHQGHLTEGWSHYAWRWKNSDFPSERIKTSRPEFRYTEKELPKRLLIWGEQGLGEQLMFANVLAEACTEAVQLILQVDRRLVDLYQASFSKNANLLVTSKEEKFPESDYDAYITYGDLVARYRNVLHDLKRCAHPILRSEKQRDKRIRGLVKRKAPIVCGVSWKSSNTQYGKLKSLNLKSLSPILETKDVQFISLQYGDVKAEIAEFRAETGIEIECINDIDNTTDITGLASLINACDCVVSTSNATVHLAGALGKRVIVLQPKGKTLWFWDHRDGDTSLWYPATTVVSEYVYRDDYMSKAVDYLNEEFYRVS